MSKQTKTSSCETSPKSKTGEKVSGAIRKVVVCLRVSSRESLPTFSNVLFTLCLWVTGSLSNEDRFYINGHFILVTHDHLIRRAVRVCRFKRLRYIPIFYSFINTYYGSRVIDMNETPINIIILLILWGIKRFFNLNVTQFTIVYTVLLLRVNKYLWFLFHLVLRRNGAISIY